MPASAGTRQRPVRRALGWSLSPADVLRLVRTDAHPVALCGAWAGGGDVVAAEPVAVRAAPGPLDEVLDGDFGGLDDPGEDSSGEDSSGAGSTGENRCGENSAGADWSGARGGDWSGARGGDFGGGWIGYLGYSAGGEALPPAGPRALPHWWFGYYDHVLRRDRATGEWHFEALWTRQRADALERRFAELTSRAASASPAQARDYAFGPFRLVPGADRHQAAVARTVEYIRRGDIFQANITLRAEADFTGDPLDAFCRGVTALDPPYAAFIGVSGPGGARPGTGRPGTGRPATGRTAVASLSPELFLRRAGGTVTSKPIKGTARRTGDAAEAAAQRAGLEASAKDRAENVMIVDLVRNDLSRVCVPGTVTVPVLLGPEPHPGVWHLVSTVTGTLNPGASDAGLVRAAFPPGSVTGAPKVRALEIIDELEAAPREAYTGAVGYRSPAAGLELNVAIRTFEFAAGKAWLGAGGGIVADSDPAAEFAECLIKAAPLLTALGAELAGQDGAAEAAQPAGPPPATASARSTGSARSAEPAEAAGRAVLTPRPSAGVFTSLLVAGGRTRGLAAHLGRLEASVRALYGKDLPASLPADLADCLERGPSGRLRITVRPVGGPLQATVEAVPLAPAGPGVTLRPVTVPGGIGAHKYRDRRLLAELAAQARTGPGEQLLLTDETGELLETDRANLFAVIDGVLLTPPADGRILPGTTRAAVLRAARGHGIRVGQKPLTLGELGEATEVFVTNAVAGVLPVTAVETANRTWSPGPVAATLAAALAAREPDAPLVLSAPARTAWSTARRVAGPAHAASSLTLVRRIRGRSACRFARKLAHVGTRPLVILIDNYDSFTWNLAHLLDSAGTRVEVVRNDEVTAAQVVAAAPAGVVISPGPCAPAEAGISIAAVTACAAAGVPLLGICLGHQAIGAAFGARIVRAPSPVHGKAFAVTHDGHGVLAGLPNPFQATRYHSLVIDEATLAADLVVTARTDGLPMGVRHRTRPVEGVQFHPESILTAHGPALIANFVVAAHSKAAG